MGTIVELLSDEKGIVWPESVAPFAYHLVSLGGNDQAVSEYAEALYADMTAAGKEVLFDDRDVRAGEKFADADLMGMPWRIVVGKDAVATGEIELMNRSTSEVTKVSRAALVG